VPGLVFGPEGEGHLRFSFSVPEETIDAGVQALLEGVRSPLATSGVRSPLAT
jgi:aspartate/methionine/tyrosine aminotransferase